jgi:spermidine synthase
VHCLEIDGELTKLGRRWFNLRNPRLEVFHEDARPFLRRIDRRYDLVIVDVYRQPYIPFYLATREFFELARERLLPGGAVIVNVGHPEGQDDLEEVLGATMAEVFPTVVRDPSEDTSTLLLGTAGSASASQLVHAVRSVPAELWPLAHAAAARIEPRLEGGSVDTDDKAPVEWLIDKSIVEYAAGAD